VPQSVYSGTERTIVTTIGNRKMTKAEEIKLFTSFVDSLPADSYLSRILAGTTTYVASMISNDHAYSITSELASLGTQLLNARSERNEYRTRAAELQAVATDQEGIITAIRKMVK